MDESTRDPENAAGNEPAEADESLAHIIDDTAGRAEAVEWSKERLIAGVSFTDLAAELVALGWAEASAESIVEEAREATRSQRGIRTRDDVVVGAYRKFSKTLRRVRWLIILAIVAMVVAISMLFNRGG